MSLIDEHLVLLAERAGATAATSDLVVALARESLKVGPDGAVKVVDAAGNTRIGGAAGGYSDMTPAELVAEIAQVRPVLFRRPEAEPVQAKPQAPAEIEPNLTRRALREHDRDTDADKLAEQTFPSADIDIAAELSAFRRSAAAARNPVNAARAATGEAIAQHREGGAKPGDTTNPYTRAQWNLTAQAGLEIRNPAKAAQLKAEAGAIPVHLDRKF